MQLPDDWVKVEQDDPDLSSLILFTPPDDQRAQLGFYYRGIPISPRSGEKFRNLLQQNSGVLSGEQVDELHEVLGDLAAVDEFVLSSVSTFVLNGRTVLLVEGSWVSTKYDSYELLIDAGQGGAVVQQVYFVAPSARFDALLPTITSCIATIDWVTLGD
ncbi:hypothetical protein [Mycobacterium sp.]|uniref:hypothetical protein n=1 Tax=Mycobacterium sp. TaxID=1785 RepID=UPI003BAF2A41